MTTRNIFSLTLCLALFAQSRPLRDEGVYVTSDGKRLHVVPPPASSLLSITIAVGVDAARAFNSTGRKLKSFRRKESAGQQWQMMADRWINALRSVPLGMNDTLLNKAFDKEQELSISKKRKKEMRALLCVHFASHHSAVLANVRANIAASSQYCRWGIVLYSGGPAAVTDFEQSLDAASASALAFTTLYQPPSLANENATSSSFVPKALLFASLLPHLDDYERTWLLDSDLSLVGFDFQKYLALLACADLSLPTSPVFISQPVVKESTQVFPVLNREAWQRIPKARQVSVIRYDTVEQQMPLFHSGFLSWFITHMVEPHRPWFASLSTDWGLDKLWCRAAREYHHFQSTGARLPPSFWASNEQQPSLCAVVPALSMSHLGALNVTGSAAPGHSSSSNRRWAYLFGGFLINKAFAARFPTWQKQSSAVRDSVEALLAQPQRHPVVLSLPNPSCPVG